jgi:hypothetical protein
MNHQNIQIVGGSGGLQNLGDANVSIEKSSLWGPRSVKIIKEGGEELTFKTINSLIKSLNQEIAKSANNPDKLKELMNFIGKVKISEDASDTTIFGSDRPLQFEELEAKISEQLIFDKFMEITDKKYVESSVSKTTWLESRNVTFKTDEKVKHKWSFDNFYDILNTKIESADPGNKVLLENLQRFLTRLKNLDEGSRNDYGTYRKRDNKIEELEEKIQHKKDAPMVYDKIKSLENYDKLVSISSENLILGSREIKFHSTKDDGITNFKELMNLLSNDIRILEKKLKENPENLDFNKEVSSLTRTFDRIKNLEEKSRNLLSKAVSYKSKTEHWEEISRKLNELKKVKQ